METFKCSNILQNVVVLKVPTEKRFAFSRNEEFFFGCVGNRNTLQQSICKCVNTTVYLARMCSNFKESQVPCSGSYGGCN